MKTIVVASILWVCLVFGVTRAAQADDASPLAAALKTAGKDGRPVLAMGTRDTCPICTRFKKRLATDPSLRALLAGFVTVNLDIDAASSGIRDLQSKKRPEGNVLPFVYSVRADGEVLGVIAGPKAQGAVDAMLRDGIAKSGRVLQAGEAAKLASALEKAKAANERGDAAQALALLAPASKGEGFAEVLVESRKLLAEIHKLAADDLAAAEKDLAESGELLPVAVKIVEAGKKYARLPEQKKAQTALVRKLGQKENGRAALAQAEDIVRARGLASSEKPDRAVQAYEQIVKKYPDTPAAALANEELAALKNK